MYKETLCGASHYEQKYYFNPDFALLPDSVKEELKILCVTFTEKAGGVITLFFDGQGHLHFQVESREGDSRFDEIGSELEIKRMQREQGQLLESLELFYRTFAQGENGEDR